MCWATRGAADLIVKRQREVDGADDEVGESEVRDEDVSSCPHLTRAHHAHEHQQAAQCSDNDDDDVDGDDGRRHRRVAQNVELGSIPVGIRITTEKWPQ